jgi:hypothetical protein
VSNTTVLDEIKALVARGSVRYTLHSFERMAERGATAADATTALSTSTSASLQANGNYRCDGGADLDGDDLTVIVALEADVVVITVF